MGRTSQRNVVVSAITIYLLLALTTDIFENHEPKKDLFKLEKLPQRPGEEVQVVEFQRRKTRVKEACQAWGAYTTKAKFLKTAQKPTQDTSKTKDELTRDRKELSQSQLERIWQLNKRTTFHQMFVDRTHSLTWCKVPKAASTSWLHAFLELAGVQDVASKDMAGKHALLREKYPLLTNSLLKRIMPTTMKFMVVRHPFERVLSAYRDKLENSERDLKDRGGYYYAIYGKRIVKAYRKPSSSDDHNYNNQKEPTFREFIQYLLDTDVEEYDEHWRPIFLLCTPCHVRFDIIAKMETLSRDADFILYHRGLSNTVNVEWSHRTDQSQKTSDVVKSYYSQLTSSEVKQLYYKYLPDFLMFEYDLDPYMRLSETPPSNSTLTINGDEENEEYYEDDDEDDEYYYDDDEEEDQDNGEEVDDDLEDTEDNNYENYVEEINNAKATGNQV